MLTWLWLVISALLLILSVVLQIGEVGNAGSMLTSGGTDFDRALRCTPLMGVYYIGSSSFVDCFLSVCISIVK